MRARWLIACALAAPLAGCETFGSTACDTSPASNPPVPYTEGRTTGDVYVSSPADGELLWFPGGMIYELDHDLGATPRWVSVWVSFAEDGVSGLARASGNEAVIRGVGPTTITVHNDGCQDFWLLVAAGTGGAQPSMP